jgi:hypothetical protein
MSAQKLCGFFRIMICGLAGFDPIKKQVLNQHAEIAAGIVDLIGFFVTRDNDILDHPVERVEILLLLVTS